MAYVARKRSKSDVQYLKDLLLRGWAIKKDGRGLLSYGHDKYRNVGSGQGDTMLNNNPKDFSEAIQELEAEGYDVRHQSCAGSGCCQYHATAYWLEMVEEEEAPRETKKTRKTKKEPDDSFIQERIETAVESGVSYIGQRNVLALAMAGIWLDGWMSGQDLTPKTVETLRQAMNNYRFQ